jgi:glutamate-1-semialdehyde 2,1-aminomutase
MIDPAWHPLLQEYVELAKNSAPRATINSIAGEATHSSWCMPRAGGPLFFARAQGTHKWDGAGRSYIDLWMGHGSLLLGNAHPVLVEAISRQVIDGQHVGGAHVLHVEWAARIRELVPSCECIRFTGSGTEATLLALRIARSFTQRPRILRLDGHFHGWHDESLAHVVPCNAGLNPGVSDWVTVVSPFDEETIIDELAQRDVAGLILEPGGGSAGSLSWSPAYLQMLRKICNSVGTLLIFDEVISGFRYAPGGVQELAGIIPDLTVLAKIAAGGMPGGLVGGRKNIMETIDDIDQQRRRFLVPHSGTFNGFPLTAASAIATLDMIGDGVVQARAEDAALSLVKAINWAGESTGVDIRAFNQSSIFHLLIGALSEGSSVEPGPAAIRLPQQNADKYTLLRCALLLEGVDCHFSHGWLSAVHSSSDIEAAAEGFSRAFKRLRNFDSFLSP